MRKIFNINIQSISRLFFIIMILFLTTVILIVWHIHFIRIQIVNAENIRYESLKVAEELMQSSDKLTMMARLYTVTGDPQYKKYYFTILGIRQGKLPRPQNYNLTYWDFILGGSQTYTQSGVYESFNNHIKKLQLTLYEQELLRLGEERSDRLSNMEQQAFFAMEGLYPNKEGKYVIHGKSDPIFARNLLHGKEYLQLKDKIMQPIAKFINAVDLRTKNQFDYLEEVQRKNILLLSLNVFIIFILLAYTSIFGRYYILKPINKMRIHVDKITKGEYQSRNNVETQNELGVLAKTLNEMCIAIEKNINIHKQMLLELQQSEDRFRSVMENSPLGTGITNLQGKFIVVNEALCRLTGYTKNELLEMGFQDITDPADLTKELELIQELIQGKIPYYQIDIRHLHKDGHSIWSALNVTVVESGGKPQLLMGQVEDITNRKKILTEMTTLNEKLMLTLKKLEEHKHDEELLNKLNEMLQVCITPAEAYERIKLIANQLFPSLSGGISVLEKETSFLETVAEWGSYRFLEKEFLINDCFCMRSGNINVVDDPKNSILCPHYSILPQGGYMGLPLNVQNESIGVIHMFTAPNEIITKTQQQLIISFSNVIKLALANIKMRVILRQQSIHDPLTGLYNRLYLKEILTHELKSLARSDKKLCVAMIDLDNFKKFNDFYGHDAGDEVLKNLGMLLQKYFRDSDIAFRYGGEEFLVILLNTELKDAYSRLEIFQEKLKETRLTFLNKVLPIVTISVGITIAPDFGSTLQDIIKGADIALYNAKQKGRDRIEIFKPEDEI